MVMNSCTGGTPGDKEKNLIVTYPRTPPESSQASGESNGSGNGSGFSQQERDRLWEQQQQQERDRLWEQQQQQERDRLWEQQQQQERDRLWEQQQQQERDRLWEQQQSDALAQQLNQLWEQQQQAEAAAQHNGQGPVQQQADAAAQQQAQQQVEAAQQQANAAAQQVAQGQAQALVTLKSITLSPGVAPATQGAASKLGESITQALKTWSLARVLGPQMAAFAIGMGIPSELGDGERASQVIATPLSQFDLPSTIDLHTLASRNGSVDISHRLQFNGVDEKQPPTWTPTHGETLPSSVRVRPVLYNPQNNTYEFIRDGDSEPVLVWTPIVNPGDSSTRFPALPPVNHGTSGFPITPAGPQLETYPADDWLPDDYILVFPIDSGRDAIYVMFKSPRYLPGVTSGQGQAFPDNWQELAAQATGVGIPERVAQALRGRSYSEFRNLKRAIWRELGKIDEVSIHINEKNLKEMKKGNSPFVPESERLPGHNRYELHHIVPISEGGEVYNIDNVEIRTPKSHNEIHKKPQQGK